MKRSEFNQLILEWNEYLIVESICEVLEDQVLAEGFRSFVTKYGTTVGLIMTLISQLNSINMHVNDINSANRAAIEHEAEKHGPKVLEIIDNASPDDFEEALEALQQSDINKVDFMSYITRVFKDSFEESLEESIRIKSFGGIYSKEVYEAWGPSILKSDTFVNEVLKYLVSDEPQSGKVFEHEGMKIFIFPFNADEELVAEEFVKNYFKQIQITSKKNNKKISINSNSNLVKLSEELSSLSIDFEVKLFKSALRDAFKGIVQKYISNKGGVTGYHYNTQSFAEEFKNEAEKLAKSEDFKDLKDKITITMNIAKGGIIAIDTKQDSSQVLETISHEIGHALSIDQGKDKTMFFNDFVTFLIDNYDFDVKENNKKISIDMFRVFIENRLFEGVEWTEIKTEKQDLIIKFCLDFLKQLESSNFIEIIKSEKETEIQLNVDILDKTQRYYHDPEERVENFKDLVVLFDEKYGSGSTIKVLTEMKDMIEYVKKNPKVKNKAKGVFSESLDMQIRFFASKAMLDLKIINKKNKFETLNSNDLSLLVLLITNNNTEDVTDCLDEVNNLIKTYHKYNNNKEHNAQHLH